MISLKNLFWKLELTEDFHVKVDALLIQRADWLTFSICGQKPAS